MKLNGYGFERMAALPENRVQDQTITFNIAPDGCENHFGFSVRIHFF